MNYPKVICSISFLLLTHLLFAQTDTLLLFTKKGCSNCAYAKKQFSDNKISYTELTVDEKANAGLMLKKLKEIGYKGSIFMPVIFINNSIMHPVVIKDTALIGVSLALAVDSIIKKYKNGELHLPIYINKQSGNTVYDSTYNKDCEMKFPPVYIVCANFTSLIEAEKFAKVLSNGGYPNANILNYKKLFRVYTEILYDADTASIELKTIRKKYRAAYLLSVN